MRKVAARYPLWNPHYNQGGKIDYAGKAGDFLHGKVLRFRTEGIGENMGAMLDVEITGPDFSEKGTKIKRGATLKGKDVRTLPDPYKNCTIVSWPVSNKYVQTIEGLTGAEGHFLTVLYGGQVKSKYDNPAADWQVELSDDPVA